MSETKTPQQLGLAFDQHFLERHAGSVLIDPATAIVELVANSWDAGADNVWVDWPSADDPQLVVADDGTGMTPEQFNRRWKTLYYNRLDDQGPLAESPPGRPKKGRRAFGRNGIGRHAMFRFADSYLVETKHADAALSVWRVFRVNGVFNVDPIDPPGPSTLQAETGTRVSTACTRSVDLDADSVRQLLGTKFVVDPNFHVFVNGTEVELTELDDNCVVFSVDAGAVGKLEVRRYDSTRGRTSQTHGVAWWVMHRLVGQHTWQGLLGPLIDARTNAAKRHTYVVIADALKERVKPDWSGFYSSPDVNDARRAVEDFVQQDMFNLEQELRRAKKREALQQNKGTIKALPDVAKEEIAKFADDLALRCPTMTARDLGTAVEVLAKMEKSRSGYSLLERLATVEPDDIDGLHQLLSEWSISDARKALGELRFRLKLIEKLSAKVVDPTADELHELQPLFEAGLWIFGPEFESVEFRSNRQMVTMLRELLGGGESSIPTNRPDIVVLPDSTLGAYTCDTYDPVTSELVGLGRVVVVELKRAGVEVSHDEWGQAMRYSRELLEGGLCNDATHVTAYVLGSLVDRKVQRPTVDGRVAIHARPYRDVLAMAHARTFRLMQHLEGFGAAPKVDEDLADVLDEENPEFDFPPAP